MAVVPGGDAGAAAVPTSRSLGERLPLALAWGLGIGLYAFVIAAAASALGDSLANVSPETLEIMQSLFPTIDLGTAGGFLQLAFVSSGSSWPGSPRRRSSRAGRRTRPAAGWTRSSRPRWRAAAGPSPAGVGVYLAIVALSVVVALGIAAGAAIGGGDIVTPVLGTAVLGLYALGLAGIGLAVGGLFRTSIAGETIAAIVILTFVVDLVAPALHAPDWVHQLALTAHLGQPMVGIWDPIGIAACLVLAVGGLALSGIGLRRRDIGR